MGERQRHRMIGVAGTERKVLYKVCLHLKARVGTAQFQWPFPPRLSVDSAAAPAPPQPRRRRAGLWEKYIKARNRQGARR